MLEKQIATLPSPVQSLLLESKNGFLCVAWVSTTFWSSVFFLVGLVPLSLHGMDGRQSHLPWAPSFLVFTTSLIQVVALVALSLI